MCRSKAHPVLLFGGERATDRSPLKEIFFSGCYPELMDTAPLGQKSPPHFPGSQAPAWEHYLEALLPRFIKLATNLSRDSLQNQIIAQTVANCS